MNSHLIRRMREADTECLAAIQSSAHEAAHWDPRGYLAFEAFVVEVDGAPVGFLVYRRIAPDEAEILNLAIAPAFRRRGIAQSLLREAAFIEPFVFFLEVRASNHAARNLYRSLGFIECGQRPGYYANPPEAAILMRRDPPPSQA